MPFSFGSSRSRSSSQSSSDAYGYSGGASESTNTSRSTSDSRGSSFGSSTQSLAFQDLFASLYGNASNVAGVVANQGVPGIQSTAQMLFDTGRDFLGDISGGRGADYLEGRAAGTDGVLDAEISGLQEDVGRFFEEELLPGTVDSAVAAGQLGGGRQGVAQGRAIDTAAREFRRGATELRRNDLASRDAAAIASAGIRQSGGVAGIQAAPGLLGLAEAGAFAQFSPLERLANIVGGPTVLTESESGSEQVATAESIADAIARSFNFGEDRATSQSSSSGSSRSFSFGAGG